MKLIVLDNYDSFTYNLIHIVRQLNVEIDVFKNDEIPVDEIENYDKILISPGPGLPENAGRMMTIIKKFYTSKKILGICLGHQGIAQVFGAQLYNLSQVLHGVTTQARVVVHDEYLFNNIPEIFPCTHYHSWAVDPLTISEELEVIAVNEQGIIMALRHSRYDVRGLQFHPESFMMSYGHQILKNWIEH